MKIIDLIAEKQEDIIQNKHSQKIPTIAFLGDSVTQGVFELPLKRGGGFETVYDTENVYHRYVGKLLALLYPNVPLNIINAGIGGNNTRHAVARLERDVLSYHPDLTVVCFGLNDCHWGLEKMELYINNLDTIFQKLIETGSEVIFMTPNMMNTYMDGRLLSDELQHVAKKCMHLQNSGVLKTYLENAKQIAQKHGVKVCDVYAKWERMQKCKVNTTNLLSNYINHPVRPLHMLFAISLIETMMQ
ncbi:MAG: GDSL family lipase [Clostridia bacterium]|nr:GDSL family lipase [Clostridia bacterium]